MIPFIFNNEFTQIEFSVPENDDMQSITLTIGYESQLKFRIDVKCINEILSGLEMFKKDLFELIFATTFPSKKKERICSRTFKIREMVEVYYEIYSFCEPKVKIFTEKGNFAIPEKSIKIVYYSLDTIINIVEHMKWELHQN